MVAVKRDERSGDALGTGRRKTSVARVRIRAGAGKILINKRELNEYFPNDQDRHNVVSPLEATGRQADVDVVIRVHGGGPTGQSGACKMGIARALVSLDQGMFGVLREGGFLTRDSRMKERKKVRSARCATGRPVLQAVMERVSAQGEEDCRLAIANLQFAVPHRWERQTMSFSPLSGVILTTFRAGFALKTVCCLVMGWIPVALLLGRLAQHLDAHQPWNVDRSRPLLVQLLGNQPAQFVKQTGHLFPVHACTLGQQIQGFCLCQWLRVVFTHRVTSCVSK